MAAAKDIRDEEILEAIRATRGKHGVPEWATTWDIQKHLDEYPAKVVLVKLRSLLKQKVIDGCGCGCRGDWNIPQNTQ